MAWSIQKSYTGKYILAPKWADEKVLKRFAGVSYVGGVRIPKRGVGCARGRSGAITDNLRITTAARDGGGAGESYRGLGRRAREPTENTLLPSVPVDQPSVL